MYLQKSCINLSSEETSPAPVEAPSQQRRRAALRQRLFSRSRQRLNEAATSPTADVGRQEVFLQGKGFEAGRLQKSLAGGKEHCFFVKSGKGDAYLMAAASEVERRCWLTR